MTWNRVPPLQDSPFGISIHSRFWKSAAGHAIPRNSRSPLSWPIQWNGSRLPALASPPQEPRAALQDWVRPALSPLLTLLAPQGRLVLSNKMARTIGFFYTLFLHCLVFLVSAQTDSQGSIQHTPLTSRGRRDPGSVAWHPGHPQAPLSALGHSSPL